MLWDLIFSLGFYRFSCGSLSFYDVLLIKLDGEILLGGL